MAHIELKKIIKIIESLNTNIDGWVNPKESLSITLKTDSQGEVFDADLSGKTLTFEGREKTVILDFDEKGYVVNIEFV